MENLKIFAKLTVSFLIVALMAMAVGLAGIIAVNIENKNVRQMNTRMSASVLSARLMYNIRDQEALYCDAALFYNLGELVNYRKIQAEVEGLAADFDGYISELEQSLDNEECLNHLTDVKQEYIGFTGARDSYLTLLRNQRSSGDEQKAALIQLTERGTNLKNAGQQLTNHLNMLTEEQTEESRIVTTMINSILVFIMAAVLIAALLFGYYISDIISRPINSCITRINKILIDGDLHSPVRIFNSRDEGGNLSRMVRDLIVSYSNMIDEQSRILKAMSKGNYSQEHEVEYTGDFLSIKTSNQLLQVALSTNWNALIRKTNHMDIVAALSRLTYWEFSPATDKLSLSTHFWDQFGYVPGEINVLGFNNRKRTDPPSKWVDIVHPDDLSHTIRELDNYISGASDSYRSELQIRSKRGEYVWVIVFGRTVEWHEGRPSLLIGGIFNIDDVKRSESANIAKNRFLASMSHEIRTPMNAIIGMSELMPTDNLDTQQLNFFNDIRSMSHMLLQIINDILDLSKIEAGKMELTPVHFDLYKLYSNVASQNKFMAANKDLEFRASFDDNVPKVVYGDDIRVRQILTNLLNNAIKYTHEGVVQFHVKSVKEAETDYIAIVIEDTGVGIRKADFEKIFGTFEQLDSYKNRGITGTGLGLPICKRLAEMMDGRIEVESEYGKGSVFTALLPLPKGDPSMVPHSVEESMVWSKGDAKVLVVDDNAINLKVALTYLAVHNIKADAAGSGIEALKKSAEKQYHLIFMDHMMPEMDGLEATAHIRAIETGWYKTVPIVALTANAFSGARELFLDNGMNDFLSKPINSAELNHVLAKWLPQEMYTITQKKAQRSGLPAGLPEPEKLIDRAIGITNAAGSEPFYEQLLADFKHNHKADSEKIRNALDTKDYAAAQRLAHTLKSTAALVGAATLASAALAMEQALNDSSAAPAPEIWNNLENMCSAVFALIHSNVPEQSALIEEKAETGIIIDKTIVLAFIKRLEDLLRINSAKSLDLLDEMREIFAPTGLEYRKLAMQIENFDFAEARTLLNEIKETFAA
ncbi:MAG: response regulator [Spirochaetaceae bacterium]|jgi:signal transduction histidine kinase/CheY-like chemotaxis protein/HPt (histidine-containing phosphotransfer) domain-containing protein|nr:response regulator [Spirochaetaceae bacterium]